MLTVNQVRNLLISKKGSKRVSRQFISEIILKGKLKAVKNGKRWLINEEDLKEFCEKYDYQLREER